MKISPPKMERNLELTILRSKGRTYASLAKKYQLGPEQIIFRFCHQIGMIPLTGTSDEIHMKADLNIFNFKLADEEIELIKTLK